MISKQEREVVIQLCEVCSVWRDHLQSCWWLAWQSTHARAGQAARGLEHEGCPGGLMHPQILAMTHLLSDAAHLLHC